MARHSRRFFLLSTPCCYFIRDSQGLTILIFSLSSFLFLLLFLSVVDKPPSGLLTDPRLSSLQLRSRLGPRAAAEESRNHVP